MPREKMAGGNLREDVAEVALEQWTERSKERRQRFLNSGSENENRMEWM